MPRCHFAKNWRYLSVDQSVHCQDQPTNAPNLHRVPDTHPDYDSLQYVLLFPAGNIGWHPDMTDENGRPITAMDYYRYYLFPRQNGWCSMSFGRLSSVALDMHGFRSTAFHHK